MSTEQNAKSEKQGGLGKKKSNQHDNFEIARIMILLDEVYYHTHGEPLNDY